MSPTVVIRTVAGASQGYGHLTRCLSLAQSLGEAGARAVLALDQPEEPVARAVAAAGAGLAVVEEDGPDAAGLLALAGELGAGAAVLDGYVFGQAYLDALSAGLCTLWLDDLGELAATSRLVLNQNPAARAADYPARPGQRLLLGLEHALLRPQFAAARPPAPPRAPERASRLLVTFGGADPNRLCARALAGLAEGCGRYRVKVVAGAAGGAAGAAREAAARSPHRVEVLERVEDMAGLMAWAELALCGSGVTGYEMCCLGLPMLVVTPVDNQLPVSRGLAAAGLIHHLGWWREVGAREMARGVDGLAADQAERARLARAGWEAVDGLGARRVAAALLEECR